MRCSRNLNAFSSDVRWHWHYASDLTARSFVGRFAFALCGTFRLAHEMRTTRFMVALLRREPVS